MIVYLAVMVPALLTGIFLSLIMIGVSLHRIADALEQDDT